MSYEEEPRSWIPTPAELSEGPIPDPTFKQSFRRWWRQGLANWIFAVFALLEGGLLVFVLGIVGEPDVMHADGAIRHGAAMFQEPPQHLFWFPLGLMILVAVVIVAHLSFLKIADRTGWSPDPRGILVNGFYVIVISLLFGWAGGPGERLLNSLWMVSNTEQFAFVREGSVKMGKSRDGQSGYANLIILHFADRTKRVLYDDNFKGPVKEWDCVLYREGTGLLGVPFARRPFRKRALTRIECPDSLEVYRKEQKDYLDSMLRAAPKPWYLQ